MPEGCFSRVPHYPDHHFAGVIHFSPIIAIHGFVPTDVVVEIGGADNPFAVPIVVALAVPLYAGAAGVMRRPSSHQR
jgi:hypothetical protein